MILNPAIIALLVSSFLVSSLVLYALWFALRILHSWDLQSGSSLQLELERRTYLISTVLAYVFGLQLVSLFLLVYTADSISTLFTGAMCAAGTFNSNFYGYLLLVLKIMNFLLAGLWLIINHADTKAYDYPLTKKKYAFLLFLSPYIVLETVLQALFFLGLTPDVITSCCGSLFSAGSENMAADIAALPAAPMQVAFSAVLLATIVLGCAFLLTGKGGRMFAVASGALFLASLASILSFISPAVYELPTHHCPFCLLQKEYHAIGYLLYILIFGGALPGLAVAVLMPFRSLPSLASIVPTLQKRYAVLSVLCSAALGLLTLALVTASNLRQ